MSDPKVSRDLPDVQEAERILATYAINDRPLFVLGTLNTGITVLSQQVRALNLVWSLVSSGALPTGGSSRSGKVKIAIIGAGFAGLTAAAALIKKGVDASIVLFEKRDTVLPLQQGSDSRWLHPHIYEWPTVGSESSSAGLPVLNWTASRASDVVVQALRAWERVLDSDRGRMWCSNDRLRIFCNTRHLQVSCVPRSDGSRFASRAHVEWVGEPRNPVSPSNPRRDGSTARGSSEGFDLVILAVGFGLEREGQPSYWRNETLAQPQLGQATAIYIVSGAGDGAMIDLFRLRIAEFRQDRILAELFAGRRTLMNELRALDRSADRGNMFERFKNLWDDSVHRSDTTAVLQELQSRLRHDTQVVLHVRAARFADLFAAERRVSFQNRLLAFLLFTCGGFHPSSAPLRDLAREYAVPPERVIKRHGTRTHEILREALAPDLHSDLQSVLDDPALLDQTDEIRWGGGYFDHEGPVAQTSDDTVKGGWRKEYLPSPTQSMAASFCAAVAGYLSEHHPPDARLRITLHRTLRIGAERVLQQCCEYVGIGIEADSPQAAGRTFPTDHATIGAAYSERRVFRTRRGAKSKDIGNDMDKLQLNDASRVMAAKVRSIAAIPILGSLTPPTLTSETETVIGVLYVDSYEADYFTDEATVNTLVGMCQRFSDGLRDFEQTVAGRITNFAYWGGGAVSSPDHLVAGMATLKTLEAVDINVPTSPAVSQINFDFSDFERVEG